MLGLLISTTMLMLCRLLTFYLSRAFMFVVLYVRAFIYISMLWSCICVFLCTRLHLSSHYMCQKSSCPKVFIEQVVTQKKRVVSKNTCPNIKLNVPKYQINKERLVSKNMCVQRLKYTCGQPTCPNIKLNIPKYQTKRAQISN